MNLAGISQYGNKNTGNNAETIKPNTGGASSAGASQGESGRPVKETAYGQTFSGEVTERSGNIWKALEAAKLPVTDDWMKMVITMMKQGMSIDKNALLDMSKLVTSHPGANPETVVLMKQMKLPVTAKNITQFENYMRYEHQLLYEISDILLELPKTLQSLTSAGQGGKGVDFYTQLLHLVTGTDLTGALETGTVSRIFTDIEADNGETLKDVTVNGKNSTEGGAAAAVGADKAEEAQLTAENKMLQDLMKLFGGQEAGDGQNAVLKPEKAAPRLQNQEGAAFGEASLSMLLHINERNNLAQMLGRLGFSKEQLLAVRQGNITGKQLLDAIILQLANGHGKNEEDLLQLFGSKEYHKILQKELLQQWLLRPEQVAKKEDVETFYRKLTEQTMKLKDIVGQFAKDTPLVKSLTNLQNNLDFMQQINQTFQYIQLPLKMSGGEAHGDLYVYTNRKSSLREDGSVSALLHLDMEHLGTMDIHVAMQDKKVSTKFYLADEAVIDFIAEHIHILNERLEKRGYQFQAQMLRSEEIQKNSNVIETLKIGEEEKKDVLLAQYSFDVRA